MKHYFSNLERTIKSHWDKPAVSNYNGETFTYGELATKVAKFHIFFESIGVRKGDKIALCAKNSARWGVSFIAITTYEAVIVPILNDFTPDSIGNLVSHSESGILFTDAEIWEKMDKSLVGGLRCVIDCSNFTLLYYNDNSILESFENLASAFEAKYPLGFTGENVKYPTNNLDDLAIINYTSGTTSAPKGVMITYGNISTTIVFGIENMYCNYEDNMVSMLPMGHIYGLVFEFLYTLCSGVHIYFLGKTPSPSLLLKAFKEIKPYMIVTVPLVMEKIFKTSIKPIVSKWYMKLGLSIPGIGDIIGKKIGRKLLAAFGGNIRMIIMGGAAFNPEAEHYFKKFRLPYTVGYGMTEASPLLAYDYWDKYVKGSCGSAIPSCSVKIDSDDPQHIAGEILAKGDNICIGYYKNPEASKNLFTPDGYIHTGDLGIIDKAGHIFIKGRSKSMILSSSGQNIYPEEVEAVINSNDYVAESVVVDRSSKLVALVYLDKDAIKRDKLDEETISDIPEKIRINSNRILPVYSQITKVEVVVAPFEKTPKLSIKRFLYK
ncbi:MAG: AMP-binding protein [Bacteroidales bacterium]|nr:AMP-binding protein [Bacteroidales bacterium]